MPKKGSTFGGPVAAPAEEEQDLTLEELGNALGNPVHDFPPIVRRRVDALTNLQKQYSGLHKQYQEEVRELERKYQKLYDPILDKREKIVSGTHEPTDEEATVEKKEEDEEKEEGVKKREAKPEDVNIKGIPQFWLTVLQNNMHVGQIICEADEDALTYLRDIRCAELEGESEGFTLTFYFAENPYFTNTTLTKTYHMEQEELFGELLFDHASGSKIDWKAGKNLTVKQIKKKTKAKGKKPARVVTVEEPCESFFSFFAPLQPPSGEEEQLEEEDAELLEMDFDIGCVIKDKLIPHSVLWFTGEAAEFEDDMDFGDDEEGDEDDEDQDEDDEDEEEEEPPKRGGKRQPGPGHAFAPPPSAKGGPGAPGQPQQPECKQQ